MDAKAVFMASFIAGAFSVFFSRRIQFPKSPKRASVYSAILLTASAYLLNLALTAFAIGLGVYPGYVYTARLIPTLGTDGSLGILTFCIVSAVLSFAVLPPCNNEATRVRSNQTVDERDTLYGTSASWLPQ